MSEDSGVEMKPVGKQRKKRTRAPRRSLAAIASTHTPKHATSKAGAQTTQLDDEMALPVRETLQNIHRIQRDKSIRDFWLFMVLMFSFVGISFNLLDAHNCWSTDAALEDLFLDEEFGTIYKKNFYEIMTMGEFWEWMEGPLVNGLYPEEWYNGEAFTEGERGYVANYMRLIGGVQIRQSRVTNSSCFERRVLDECVIRNGVCEGRFDTKGGWCYAEFSETTQATAPFGPPEDPTRYTFQDGLSPLNGLWGFGYDYGTGGYVTELPLNRTEAIATIAQMKADLWTDAGTRAVAIDFNLYNTNSKLASMVRVVFEVDFTSRFIKFAKIFTVKVVVYGWSGTTIYDYSDVFRTAGEVLYICMVGFFLQKEIRRFYWTRQKCSYFNHAKNLTEVVLLLTNIMLLSMWTLVLTDKRRTNFNVNEDAFVDMFTLAEGYVQAYTVAGALGLMYSLKLFRFLAINKQMATMWETLYRASGDLAAFLVGFSAIATGFAVFGQYTFGYILVDFHNLASSLSTVLRFSLGDFAYDELSVARPRLAGLYFTLYIAIVFFVMINIIIGIITKYFDETHQEAKVSDRWKRSAKSVESDVMLNLGRKCRRCCAPLKRNCGKSKNPEHRRRMEVMFAEQEDGYRREKEYLQQLRVCIRASKRVSGVDLLTHLNQVFKAAQGQNVFLGVHELCQLTRFPACSHDEHVSCEAAKLLVLYGKMKEVSLIGNTQRYESATKNVDSLTRFKVAKVNKYGLKQRRLIAISPLQFGYLLNFDVHMRLRRRLPLEQLIQIDQDRTDARRLDLHFTSDTSQSPSVQALTDKVARKMVIEARLGLETHYQLLFENGSTRDEFLSLLLNTVDGAANKPKTLKRTPSGLERQLKEAKGEHQHISDALRSLTCQVAALKRDFSAAAVHA